MATYLSPGVYVEEIPSEIKPIAGVGTSTGGFIGFFGDEIQVPKPNPKYDPTKELTEAKPLTAPESQKGEISKIEGTVYTVKDLASSIEYQSDASTEVEANLRVKNRVEYTLNTGKTALATIKKPASAAATASLADGNKPYVLETFKPRPAGEVVLCTNFTEFRQAFGNFSTDPGHSHLAYGVYGFFQNGGTRCWVAREKAESAVQTILDKFEAIDEIAVVATPGCTNAATWDAVITHCEKLNDRFAVLDTPEHVGDGEVPKLDLFTNEQDRKRHVPRDSKNAAIYFPWILAADFVKAIQEPTGEARRYVPPSGHVAGIYARVDQERGVHKAPANEVLRGALDLRYYISKAHQESLNPIGINCIRDLNGAIRVWGARTAGGARNTEFAYVNIRRTFLYLMESIDEGTQWVVFEPNDEMLWAKLKRNITAFLTNVWRDGALFGSTPQEAFYVKCDKETNPPEIREQGQVVTEIGVALTRPAEFVIFHMSQWAGSQKQ
ncbi:MAG: phage tail sheath family protein [Nitrospira sp.]